MKLRLGSNDHTVELKNNDPEADMDFSVIIDGDEDIMPQFEDQKSYSANSEYFNCNLICFVLNLTIRSNFSSNIINYGNKK